MALRCGVQSDDKNPCELEWRHEGQHKSLLQLYGYYALAPVEEVANPERVGNGCMIYRRDR